MSFCVVIPSRNASNLATCVDSILTHEPDLPRDKILVVDDGVDSSYRDSTGLTWLTGVRPFIFARNVNRGILATNDDVILMNDDSRLLTPGGFSSLVSSCPVDYGVLSAAVREHVGNLDQLPRASGGIRQVIGAIAFICVLIPRRTIYQVGYFDERFTAYGSEDNDYCMRVKGVGLKTGVFDLCLVSHDGISTFRSQPDNLEQLRRGRAILAEKWKTR